MMQSLNVGRKSEQCTILNECPLTKYENGLEDVHKVTLDAKDWIDNLQIEIEIRLFDK